MKKLFFLLALTAAVSCNAPQELTVMTLNMRYDNPEDGANNWRFRRERIAELIRSEAVDLLGTQEVLANQFDDLQALLPGYRAVGVGREDVRANSTPYFSAATVSNCSIPACSG